MTLPIRLAVSALIVNCEAIAASGDLPEHREYALRRAIANVKAAFVANDNAPDLVLAAVGEAMGRE